MNALQSWSKGRLIAVDHGSRSVKLLLVETGAMDIKVLGHKTVDLLEEGLLASEEIQRHVAELLEEWAEWPIVAPLPAHLSFAQILDLPTGGESDIPRVIEEQTGRLRGITNSPLVYEAVALTPHGRLQKPYFVTIAREQDVDQHLQRITARATDVRDVSSFANALVSAHTALQPSLRHCVLVDCGASATVLAIVRDGQQVFASSFAVGGNALVDALARARKLAVPEAEAQLGAQNLFAGAQRVPGLCAAADNWLTELRKTLDDWRKQYAGGLAAETLGPVILSGGVLRVPGWLEYLQDQRGFTFSRWPRLPGTGDESLLSDFAAAYGAAVAAARRPLDSPSLLPPPLRAHRQQLSRLAKVNVVGVVCLLLAALVVALATWHKAALVVRKRGLAQKAEAAAAQVRQLENLARQRDQTLERCWPLLDQQERTLNLLHTLRVLQQGRAHHDFWCVLLADSDSYAHGTTLPVSPTNRPGFLPLATSGEENVTKPGFVFELCVPAQGDQTLKVVGDVVADLRKDPLFGRVDSVPAIQRRALVDAKVLIPDRHFAVSVDFADLGWRSLFQTLRFSDSFACGTNSVRRLPAWSSPRGRALPVPLPAISDQPAAKPAEPPPAPKPAETPAAKPAEPPPAKPAGEPGKKPPAKPAA